MFLGEFPLYHFTVFVDGNLFNKCEGISDSVALREESSDTLPTTKQLPPACVQGSLRPATLLYVVSVDS